jgi:hypothetical protein
MIKKMILPTVAIFGIVFQSKLQASPRSEKIKEAVLHLSACGNFIRYDSENVYTGFGSYWTSQNQPREPKPSVMRFVSIEQSKEYQVETLDSVVDVPYFIKVPMVFDRRVLMLD